MNPLLRRKSELEPNITTRFDENLPLVEVWREYYDECRTNGILVKGNARPDGKVERIPGTIKEEIPFYADQGFFVTDEKTGRQKFFLTRPTTSIAGVLADSFMIVTVRGSDPKKQDVGHVHVDTSRRWEHEPMQQFIMAASKSVLAGEIDAAITEEERTKKDQLIQRHEASLDLSEDNTGLLVVRKILEGPGHGRIWSVYYPTGMGIDLLTPQDNNQTHHRFSLGLGLGMTVVQGDISDEFRSEAGKTHVVLENGAIRPNFVEYLEN
jgi:hypothetical protein